MQELDAGGTDVTGGARGALRALVPHRRGGPGKNTGPPLRLFAIVALLAVSAALGAGRRRRWHDPSTWRPTVGAGRYIAALNGFIQVIGAPGGDAFLDRRADHRRVFEYAQLTADGRAPRSARTIIHRLRDRSRDIPAHTHRPTLRQARAGPDGLGAGPPLVADLPGVSATFSSTLNQVAYLRIPDPTRSAAVGRVGRASLTAQNRSQLTQTLAWLIAKHAAIVVRDSRTAAKWSCRRRTR